MDGPVGFLREQRQHKRAVGRQRRLVIDRVAQLPEDQPRVRLHVDPRRGIPAHPRPGRERELGAELVAAGVGGEPAPERQPQGRPHVWGEAVERLRTGERQLQPQVRENDGCPQTTPNRQTVRLSDCHTVLRSFPVISFGTSTPSRFRIVGPTSRSEPPSRRGPRASSPSPTSTSGTGLVVCAVWGPPVRGSIISSQLPWSAVTSSVALALSADASTRARQVSTVSTALTAAASTPE